MKTLYKLSSILLVFPLLLNSCVEELKNNGELENYSDCHNIYFQSLAEQNIELEPADEKEFTIRVFRERKENPEDLPEIKEVPINVTSSVLASGEPAFNVSKVNFAEGETETKMTVKFPEAEIGKTYDCTISITEPEYVSKYSKDPTKLVFNVTRIKWIPEKSEDGEENMGLFCDGLLCEMLTGLTPYIKKPITIERRGDKQGIYRIKDLYNDEYLARMLDIPVELVPQTGVKLKPSSIIIDASNPSKVIWKKGSIGIDIGYGDISFFSMIPEYYPEMTNASALYGTMKDGIITFPPNAIGFQTGSIEDVINRSGKTKIIFPGYKDIDYTLDVKAGISDSEGKLPIDIKKGKDINTIKYTVLKGNLPALGIIKAANKIGEGTLEAQTLEKGAKRLEISMEETGPYTVVFAGFDVNNKYIANAGTSILYIAKGDEKPVMLNCGIIVSDKYASEGKTAENSLEIYMSGNEITKVHYGLYPKDLYESMPEDIQKALKRTAPVNEKTLNLINSSVWSGVIDKLHSGSEYILIVIASNGYSEQVFKVEAKTEGLFDPFQADYFPASLKKDVSKEEFLANEKMYLYQYNNVDDKRVNLGEVKLSDGGQIEAEGKQVEIINIEGIWKAACSEDKNFKIEKDITTFVYMDGLLYNWKSSFGKVSAEVVNPENGSTFVTTQPAALTSIFQSQNMGPIPLSYVGGLTKEGNVAFMDSGEFEEDEGACIAIGLGLYSDNRLDELNAIIAVLSDFILVKEANMPEKTILQKARIITPMATKTWLSEYKHSNLSPVGRFTEVSSDFLTVPAKAQIKVEF